MKNIKKLLALLLALAMVFCFVACDSEGGKDEKKEDESIEGEWVCKLDVSDALEESMGDMPVDFPSGKVYMLINMELSKKGELELSMGADEDSFEKFFEKLIDSMVNEGYLDEDQAEETLDRLLESMTEEFSFMEISGEYKVDEKEGRIYVGEDEDELEAEEDYFEFELDGGELKITGMAEEGEEVELPDEVAEMGMDFPWVFEKK